LIGIHRDISPRYQDTAAHGPQHGAGRCAGPA